MKSIYVQLPCIPCQFTSELWFSLVSVRKLETNQKMENVLHPEATNLSRNHRGTSYNLMHPRGY